MLRDRERFQRRPSFPVQLVDLVLIELTNWRWSWRSTFLTGMVAPLLGIAGLGVFARDTGAHALAYVLTGNIVLALMFENQDKIAGHFVYMRFNGILGYFATLPIQKHTLILAVVLSFLFLSLPSLVVTALLGSLLLGVPIAPNPVLLIVAPMCAIPMAGIGALIGNSARTPQEAGSFSFLVTFLMFGLGPVVIPPERLPGVMLFLGRFSPATYAASALRQALLGPLTGQIVLDLSVLAAFTMAVFWLVGRKMDWRQG
jgi:ABC-2 type transport system permease protein